VTNQRDKAPNLALLDALDERVRNAWERDEGPADAVEPPTSPPTGQHELAA